jgi:hypothetical protein
MRWKGSQGQDQGLKPASQEKWSGQGSGAHIWPPMSLRRPGYPVDKQPQFICKMFVMNRYKLIINQREEVPVCLLHPSQAQLRAMILTVS